MLCKQREAAGLVDQINIDLTYSVCFNLANQYHANKQYTEALNTFSLIVKNKQYAQSGRLRVNVCSRQAQPSKLRLPCELALCITPTPITALQMGNIYYEQKKYSAAIKMYRMALDQIPNTGREIRCAHLCCQSVSTAARP